MAFNMYQFTRGEGPLKTTQDLFTQAEYFAEEANRLYKVIRQFSYTVRTVLLYTNAFIDKAHLFNIQPKGIKSLQFYKKIHFKISADYCNKCTFMTMD